MSTESSFIALGVGVGNSELPSWHFATLRSERGRHIIMMYAETVQRAGIGADHMYAADCVEIRHVLCIFAYV